MRIVIAMDSFKGSLTSREAGEAVAEGIRRAYGPSPGNKPAPAASHAPVPDICVVPMADGGEGTMEAITHARGGEIITLTVTGPLGTPVNARCGILPDGTAVLEMAEAAGLPLVPETQRDPLRTTTCGVGEMIRHAIRRGCRRFLIGIGGSATNDGGVGMLQSLGYEFTMTGEERSRADCPAPATASAGECPRAAAPLTAASLEGLTAISGVNALPELTDCSFRIACDVTNPLCGPSGCSAVFAPQKGATPESIRPMDAWLANYARLAKEVCPHADPEAPGAGAAGGLGFAFRTFLKGELESGVDIVLKETGLEALIREADLVITGEGRLDAQTLMGKAPSGVARLARKYGKPVIAFAGCVSADAGLCNQEGIDAFFPILREVTALETAMEPENARENLIAAAEQVFRLLYIAQKVPGFPR